MYIEHVFKLLHNFTLEIVILFVCKLLEWQETLRVDGHSINVLKKVNQISTENTS